MELSSFFAILAESIKLVPRNGKLMVLIGLVSVILNSALLFLFNLLFQSLAMDVILSSIPNPNSFNNVPDPTSFTQASSFNSPLLSPRIKTDAGLLISLEIVFILALSAVLILSTSSIIIVSTASYCAKTLSIKEFSYILPRTLLRPLITFFYISGLTISYILVIGMLVSPLMIFINGVTVTLAIILGISAFAFYLYLSVPWALSMVISVVEEECYGARALGKAATLVKGWKLHGFLLNAAYYLVLFITLNVVHVAAGSKWLMGHLYANQLFMVLFAYTAKFLVVVAYTVLYFECNKINGEKVELNMGSLNYSKLPITQEMSGDVH